MRVDFVTNSSSASYLLIFKTPGMNKDWVIDELIQCYKEEGPYRIMPSDLVDNTERKKQWLAEKEDEKELFKNRIEDQLEELAPGLFKLPEYTSMHNSWRDGLPEYLQEFIFRIISRKGFEIVSLEITSQD